MASDVRKEFILMFVEFFSAPRVKTISFSKNKTNSPPPPLIYISVFVVLCLRPRKKRLFNEGKKSFLKKIFFSRGYIY